MKLGTAGIIDKLTEMNREKAAKHLIIAAVCIVLQLVISFIPSPEVKFSAAYFIRWIFVSISSIGFILSGKTVIYAMLRGHDIKGYKIYGVSIVLGIFFSVSELLTVYLNTLLDKFKNGEALKDSALLMPFLALMLILVVGILVFVVISIHAEYVFFKNTKDGNLPLPKWVCFLSPFFITAVGIVLVLAKFIGSFASAGRADIFSVLSGILFSAAHLALLTVLYIYNKKVSLFTPPERISKRKQKKMLREMQNGD